MHNGNIQNDSLAAFQKQFSCGQGHHESRNCGDNHLFLPEPFIPLCCHRYLHLIKLTMQGVN